MKKLRVWWISQVGSDGVFYVPVKDVIEAKKTMDILAAYDEFQFENNIKGDFCNVGGLQMYDEENEVWVDWFLETEDDYFDNVDEYVESLSLKDVEEFARDLYSQVSF